MPAHLHPHLYNSPSQTQAIERTDADASPRVHVSPEDEDAIADIYRTLTEKTREDSRYPEPHSSFDKFLEAEFHAGRKRSGLGVYFRSLTTWGEGDGHSKVKTLGTALWRTLTFQDIYEWTMKPWISNKNPQDGRPLIRDFSGVVREGEIML